MGLKDQINPNAVDSARRSMHVQLGATSSPREAFSELKNLCVWNETDGGMGSFYRFRHELVFVFKVGDGAHTNSFGLGDMGRYRSNVWDYAGINSLSQSRKTLALGYKDDAYQQMEAARAAGKPAPPIYPHPDDVVLDDSHGLHVIGPADADEQRKLEQTLHVRDTLLLQDELDQRLWSAAQSGTPGGALLMAVALDQTIRERSRLNDVEIGPRACRHQAMTKRTLLKALYGAWKTLGAPVKRGWVFPSQEHVAAMLAFGIDLVATVRDGRVSAQPNRPGKPAPETERYLQNCTDRIERAS